MNVAVLAHSFPRFSGDTHGPFVKALSEALARRGHVVHVLVPFDRELRPDPATPLHVDSFRYVWPDRLHLLGYSRTLKRDIGLRLGSWLESPLYFAAAERALARLVRAHTIDLVHAHWLLPNGFVAWRVARKTGVPYAVTLHGSDVFMAERNPLFRAMARSAALGAAHITSCSAELGERLLRITGADLAPRLHLVANGTDIVPPRGADIESARTRLIVAVGRLVDKKGFRYLVDAMPRVLAQAPEARLTIGGGGELAPTLRDQVRDLGLGDRVHFTGSLSHGEVLALIASAEVFVMPSIRDPSGNVDGLPVVVLEAMAAGRPVVATDVSGMSLAVEQGRTGLLVPEQDPAALAAGILSLLNEPNLARSFGEAGRLRVQRELNWEAIAERHDRLYAAAVTPRTSDKAWPSAAAG